MTAGLDAAEEATLAAMGYRGGGVSEVERPDGSIVYRARTWHGKREIACGIWPTEELAHAAVERMRVKLAGDAVLPGSDTLRGWGTKWMERREIGGRVRGVHREWSVWRRHVMTAAFADMPLKAIGRKEIVRWIYERLHEGRAVKSHRIKNERGDREMKYIETDKPLSRQTVVHALKILRLCLKQAVLEEQIDHNVAIEVEVPRADSVRVAWTWLRTEEIAALLAAESEEARLLWTVAIYTGLRKGELAGLRWSDVTLDGPSPQLHVQRSYDGPTKSGLDRRVPLLPPTREALERWREIRPGIGAAPVWVDREGHARRSWWDPGDWTRRSLTLLGRPVRFHDLRHTCASHLVQGTWGRVLTIPEAGKWLGHGSTRTTERYAHLAPEGLLDRAREMSAAWAVPGDEEDEGADVVPLDGGKR